VPAASANHDKGATLSQQDMGGHQTVLLVEAVEGLKISPEGIYVDATFGRGGHSRRILSALGPDGRLIGLDRDADAIAAGRVVNDQRFRLIHAPFSALKQHLAALDITQIDGLLLDLGVSSPQLDVAERGFSFQSNGPLDMRMDQSSGEPVSAWLARASTSELVKVIADYGEERFAFPIADAITSRCQAAAKGQAEPLETTGALADLVAETLRRCGARKEIGRHPATRTFQALRIYINHELEELITVLQDATQLLRDHGRIAVISFHSLEDRVVKQFFRDHSIKRPVVKPKGVSRGQHALMQALHDQGALPPKARQDDICLKPIARIHPSPHEIAANPRSRSATLRIAERLPRTESPT
jgi:16S rRNA (cytosine1402-N4)-methyltransferase